MQPWWLWLARRRSIEGPLLPRCRAAAADRYRAHQRLRTRRELSFPKLWTVIIKRPGEMQAPICRAEVVSLCSTPQTRQFGDAQQPATRCGDRRAEGDEGHLRQYSASARSEGNDLRGHGPTFCRKQPRNSRNAGIRAASSCQAGQARCSDGWHTKGDVTARQKDKPEVAADRKWYTARRKGRPVIRWFVVGGLTAPAGKGGETTVPQRGLSLTCGDCERQAATRRTAPHAS